MLRSKASAVSSVESPSTSRNTKTVRKLRGKSLNGLAQDFLQLRLVVLLLWIRTPIRDFTRDRIFFGLYIFIQRDHAFGPTTAQFHQRFVDRDPDQPGIELGLTLELIQIGVSLEERILHHIFRVFAVLRDVLRDAKYIPVIAPD